MPDSKYISTLDVSRRQFQGRCECWAPGLAVDTPVTQLELAREGSTQGRGTGLRARHSWVQLACAEHVLLLDYYIGNHVAFVAATQEQAFGMTANKMQNYLKTHLL